MEGILVALAAQNVITMVDEYSNSLLSRVGSEAKDLSNELKKLEKFVVKAERGKQEVDNNEQFREWWKEVRRLGYEAEDMVDSLVSATGSSVFNSLRLRSRSDSKKLGRLKGRVSDIVKKYGQGPSKKNLGDGHVNHEPTTWQGHPHDDHNFVVGIEADVENLVQMLVAGGQTSCSEVLVIGGIGGSGKTTLATKLYYHPEVKVHFQHHVWVCFPEEWSDSLLESFLPKSVKKKLLKAESSSGSGSGSGCGSGSGSGSSGSGSGEELMRELQNLLQKNKCLVVLDNVWNWKLLQEFLNQVLAESDHHHHPTTNTNTGGCFKSKIVITSRKYLPSPDTDLKWAYHQTKLLSHEDSWELFNKVSTSSQGRELAREYRGLAMKMLAKCRGLPLAIVALGRLLKNKDTLEDWERVYSQMKGEDGSYLYGPVTDILALSYYELPHYLKPFFLYSGILAEDSISAGTLRRMWIAEGFVKHQQLTDETPERAATRLLKQLVDHTMVQAVTHTYTHKVKTIQVHNLMRDVCVRIAHEIDFLTLFNSPSSHPQSRRAAINLSQCSSLPYSNSSLRSLLLFGKSTSTGLGVGKQYGSRGKQQEIVDLAVVFEKFKLLRVLDINGIKTYDGTMPKEVGNLIHLRYLGIRSTNIQELPKSIGKLHKLLTLDYWEVSGDNEIRLPNVFWKLDKLRHLFLPNEMMSNRTANLRLDTLKELQTLWGVKGGDWMLKEMETLSISLTKLYIQGISSKQQLEAVFHCPAIMNTEGHLYALVLDWYGVDDFSLDCIHKACSNDKLKKLRLLGRAPDELMPVAFPSQLGKLELYYTHLQQADTMDALGKLPQLKFLRLGKDSFVGEKWIIAKNALPLLEELNLSDLPNLKEWTIQTDTMPCLKKLSIISCANLQKVPQGLKSITTLETFEIRRMPTAFTIRLRQPGDGFHVIQHIRNLTIVDSCTQLS